jgi:hypothetical protein
MSVLFFRFIRSVGIVDTVSARKFLEAAMSTDDPMYIVPVSFICGGTRVPIKKPVASH